MTDRQIERRDYFRILDTIGLSYSILADAGGIAPGPQGEAEASLATLLTDIDIKFNQAENTLWSENPTIAQALGLLNRKISLLASHQLQQAGQAVDAHDELEASISGSGLAFPCAEEVPVGARLWVSIVLKPSNIELHFTATVVACEQLLDYGAGNYWLRISIDETNRAAREQLVQHVVQKQSGRRADPDSDIS